MAATDGVKKMDKYAVLLDWMKTLGAPTVICAVVMWFSYDTIQWERSQLLPALQETAKTLDKTANVLARVEDKLNRETP